MSSSQSYIKSVRVEEVIVVESTIGEGTEGNPYRALTEYFSRNGDRLAYAVETNIRE